MLYSFCLSWCIGWWLDGYLWVEDFVSCQTGGSVVKNLLTNAGDVSSIPHLGYPLEEGMPTHSSILAQGNPMDRGAWWATVSGIARSWTQLKRLSSSSSRLVITFLSRSKRLLILWLQSPSTVILESRKITSVTVSTVPPFPMKWSDWMPLS